MITRRSSANLFLTGAIAAEVTATVSLKAALVAPGLITVVVLGYGASFLLLAITLRFGKGIAATYGIWGASGVVLTALASYVLFDEQITPRMAWGFGLIAIGIAVVEAASIVPPRRARKRDVETPAGDLPRESGI